MKKITLPAFGEEKYYVNRENSKAVVMSVENADKELFDDYCRQLSELGYEKKEEYVNGTQNYAAYFGDGVGYFLNHYGGIKELRVVENNECNYFSFSDNAGESIVQPQITQLTLEDFGMSYAIRLSDGRFIVIDGGFNFETDVDRLYECLLKEIGGQKPVIALWILSHAHEDHFHCFIGFMKKYGDEVVVQKVMLNFPEYNDLERYPGLAHVSERFGDVSGVTNIPLMWEAVKNANIEAFVAHTGQKYTVGDAKMEILASTDDTIHVTNSINAQALIIRMEIGGQTIIWATDSSFSYAKLSERYGEYLKADILQIPHHGFQSGTAEAEIEGYKLISPKICLLPTDDYIAYTFFCTFRKGTRFLMTAESVEEIITGSEQRTLTLPYTPDPEGKRKLREKFSLGLDSDGARVWVFTELNTGREEDLAFTLLNTTVLPVNVKIELFFEDKKDLIKSLRVEVKGSSLKRFNILGDEVEDVSKWFSSASLKKKGLPENAPFAVRFICDTPVVISNAKHQPTYRSTLN